MEKVLRFNRKALRGCADKHEFISLSWLSLASSRAVLHTCLPVILQSNPYPQICRIRASVFLNLHTDNAVRNLQAACLMPVFSSKQFIIANVTYQLTIEVNQISAHHGFYDNITDCRKTLTYIFDKFIHYDYLHKSRFGNPINFSLRKRHNTTSRFLQSKPQADLYHAAVGSFLC